LRNIMHESHRQRIFITGATGLLGSFIARVLYARGYHNLVALRRRDSDFKLVADIADKIQWIPGDVQEVDCLEEGMRNTDYVIHCAALISYDTRRYREMHGINVTGTANMINIALAQKVQRFVHISSIAACTRTGGEQHIDESTGWNRTRYNTEYGFTKHLAEMEVYRGQAEGLETLILRPSVVLGGGRWDSGSSRMFQKVRDGVRIYPTGVTGFVDARDIGRFIIHDLQSPVEHQTLLLNAENRSYQDILEHIADLLDKSPPRIRLSPWVAEAGWRLLRPLSLLTGITPTLTRDLSRTTQCRMYFDSRRSLSIMGFTYTPLERTLRDICSYLQATAGKKYDGLPMPLKG
jgi:dihydroflavonol-4-reductase